MSTDNLPSVHVPKMLSDDAFQRLLYDLFCTWHGVQRHYDPPPTNSESEKMLKIRSMLCKLIDEIDARVEMIKGRIEKLDYTGNNLQDVIEEWAMLTWNVLCITSRLQLKMEKQTMTPDEKHIYSKLNHSLITLVNCTSVITFPQTLNFDLPETKFKSLSVTLSDTMQQQYKLYQHLKSMRGVRYWSAQEVDQMDALLREFSETALCPFINMFKNYCNAYSVPLWREVRSAQVSRMIHFVPFPDEPVARLVSFYSYMVYALAILAARLQGFRFELTQAKIYETHYIKCDPVQSLMDIIYGALELLMSDCVLCVEPSTDPILVTNNLFPINCGALARGVVFKQFDVQLVTEEAAEHIQSEMRRQKLLQEPAPIQNVQSAALLAMKPATGTKRSNASTQGDGSGNTSHKKSDVNSKDIVTIYPNFNTKNRYWAATYPHLLCTTRQKGRQSAHNSYQDLSPNAQLDAKNIGKRPIFYFHIHATMFSPSGKYADAHTLSLPLTIATRRNQDCQVQRMMSSYTATCFWLYGSNVHNGLLLTWTDTGMGWDNFKMLFKQHFRINAGVQRTLMDRDFDLLQYKLTCNDCRSELQLQDLPEIVTFKNMLCPHLRYECGTTNVRFSVWRGMLELLQIFQDQKTHVRKFWERNLILGFMEFDQVSKVLERYDSALIMRLSFVTGGSICFTVKSNAHSLDNGATAPMHLEPLDLKKLQAKCIKDYLRDIAIAEKVKYVLDADFQPVLITDLIKEWQADNSEAEDISTSRMITSNVTHSGDIKNMQSITFTAMRIAVVTCKVKPPSADDSDQGGSSTSTHLSPQTQHPLYQYNSHNHSALPARDNNNEEFLRELFQLCNVYGKSKQDVIEAVDQAMGTNPQYSPLQSLNIRSNDSNGMVSQPESANPTPPHSAGFNAFNMLPPAGYTSHYPSSSNGYGSDNGMEPMHYQTHYTDERST
uniref:UL46 n=1 Tax=Panagrellus redivivus TaxID=6233 RepID=A0A7E4USI0_PANRE